MTHDYPYSTDYTPAPGEPAILTFDPHAPLPGESIKGHPNYRRLSDPHPEWNWGLLIIGIMLVITWLGLSWAALKFVAGS